MIRRLALLVPWLVLMPALAQDPTEHPKHDRLTALSRKTGLVVLEVRLVGDPGAAMAAQARRAAQRVAAGGIDLVVARVDLKGAWGQSSEIISDALLEMSTRALTVALVERYAVDAGSMVGLSAHFVAMAPGALFGALREDGGVMPSDVPYLAARYQRIAEDQGHPSGLARAMVDEQVELVRARVGGRTRLLSTQELDALTRRGLRAEGAVPALPRGERYAATADDAVRDGLAIIVTRELEPLWTLWSLDVARVETLEATWTDPVVDFASNTWVLLALLALGAIGLYLEAVTPGFGLFGVVGLASLALALGVQYASGAAQLAEIALLALGLALVFVELFVTPGFGWVGVTGLLCTAFGMLLCLQSFVVPETSWQQDQLGRSVLVMAGGFSLGLIGSLTALRLVPHTPFLSRIALNTEMGSEAGYVAADPALAALVGRQGLTATALRPAGKLTLDGQLLDVTSAGEHIGAGEAVVVREVEGNRIVVERLVHAL